MNSMNSMPEPRLLELGDALQWLLRQFTREEALWYLLPVSKACGRLLQDFEQDFEAAQAGSQAPWRPRTPPSELAKTLRRLQFWYGDFNGGRELRCMQIFTRLLHELCAEGVVEWGEQQPPPAENGQRALADTCVFGFSWLAVYDIPEFTARCREMFVANACMRDQELGCVWYHHDPEWIAYKMLRCNGLTPWSNVLGQRTRLSHDSWIFGLHIWHHEEHKRRLKGMEQRIL